jgi:hypothetical protein
MDHALIRGGSGPVDAIVVGAGPNGLAAAITIVVRGGVHGMSGMLAARSARRHELR